MADSLVEVNTDGKSKHEENEMIKLICSIIPPLSFSSHKGQNGRIGIIGGSREYTGAPYFAAISALKVGCDLSYVFCSADAAPIIKSYSPELIVYPILGEENGTKEIISFLPRLHSLVIGPGLGRNMHAFSAVENIIDGAKRLQLPILLDADALFYINSNLEIIKGYNKAVLTPNKVELSRLYSAVYKKDPPSAPKIDDHVIKQLSEDLGNVTLVCKGPTDIITNGQSVLTCVEPGSPRRCGGQGDLLSGSMGVFLHWSHQPESCNHLLHNGFSATMIAALGASMLTRRCSKLAFQKFYRSMTTSDMISEIGNSFTSLFAVHK